MCPIPVVPLTKKEQDGVLDGIVFFVEHASGDTTAPMEWWK
jgi:hypothetical protein